MTIEQSILAVLEFHIKFKVPVLVNRGFPSDERRNLRINLLKEEVAEVIAAVAFAEMAREMADIEYITCGTLIEYGLWGDVRMEDWLGVSPGMISNALSAYLDAEKLNSIERVRRSLLRVLYCNRRSAEAFGVPLDAVFAEVHRSNMAKLGPDGEPIRRADGKVLKPAGWTPPDIVGVLKLQQAA